MALWNHDLPNCVEMYILSLSWFPNTFELCQLAHSELKCQYPYPYPKKKFSLLQLSCHIQMQWITVYWPNSPMLIFESTVLFWLQPYFSWCLQWKSVSFISMSPLFLYDSCYHTIHTAGMENWWSLHTVIWIW